MTKIRCHWMPKAPPSWAGVFHSWRGTSRSYLRIWRLLIEWSGSRDVRVGLALGILATVSAGVS